MTAVITHSTSTGGVVDATADVDGAAWDANHVITGAMDGTQGGFGADVSASSGVPLFATGVATFTSTSGTGNFVRVTSPTLVTPTLGAALATSINGNTFTTGTYTLTGTAGKTFTFSNTLTLAGTDGTTMTFPTTNATIARTDAANTFTGTQTIGALVATTVNGNTLTTGTYTLTGTAGKTLTFSNSLTLAGTDSTTHTFPTTNATIARTDTGQTFTGTQAVTGAVNVNGTISAASATASALTVGAGGANNPAFQVDASVASQVAGLKVTGAATGGTVALAAVDTGSNTNLSIDAKGSGTITLGGTSTGAIVHTRASTFSAAITYGGVTLSNAVTGTGNMVLATSPTLTTPLLGTPTSGTLTNCTGLPLAGLASQAAWTFLFNNTSGSAAPTAGTIDALTLKGTPAAGDEVFLWDVAGSALKKATVSGIGASAGVSSLNSLTGAISVTLAKQVFTATGTYTPTTGMVYAMIECQGPGGGGGGAAGIVSDLISGAGGGSGAYSRTLVTAASVGASKAVTIGTGGAAGASGNNAGAAGSGASSVGTLCTAGAGAGGAGSGGAVAAGGAGGTAGTGDLAIAGGKGESGPLASIATVFLPPGKGADSFFGRGGTGTSGGTSVSAGVAGTGFGAGGSGGSAHNIAANTTGGAGTDGVVFITEYIVH